MKWSKSHFVVVQFHLEYDFITAESRAVIVAKFYKITAVFFGVDIWVVRIFDAFQNAPENCIRITSKPKVPRADARERISLNRTTENHKYFIAAQLTRTKWNSKILIVSRF